MDFDLSEASHSTKKLSFVIIYFCHFLLFHLTFTSAPSNLRSDRPSLLLLTTKLLFLLSQSVFILDCGSLFSKNLLHLVHHFASAIVSASVLSPALSQSFHLPPFQCFSLQRFHQSPYHHFNSHCTLFYIYHIKPISISFAPSKPQTLSRTTKVSLL